MKRIKLIIFALAAFVSTANAQIVGDGTTNQTNDDDSGFVQRDRTKDEKTEKDNSKERGTALDIKTKHYNYELSLGPRFGAGVVSMSEGDGLSIADGGGTGFGGGLAANIRFGSRDSRGRELDGQGLIGVALELNYSSMSVKTKADDLSMGCIQVPVLLQVYPCYNTKQLKNLYIEAGPTFTGVMSASPKSMTIDNTTYYTGEIKAMDVKATIGVGYRFNKTSANDGFYVNARYYLGTSDLAGNLPAKTSSAEISIGYLFKCIGTKK